MKIVADAKIPFVREAFSLFGEVHLVPSRQINAATVHDAGLLLVRSKTRVDAGLLEGSKVRFVGTGTSGIEHVDRAYLETRGIPFVGALGSNANSVAQYVVAALLQMAHRQQFRLRDRTLGVIGVGNIGRRIVRYAETLGMRVLQNDPPRQRSEKLMPFVSLEDLLAESDVITLHVPLIRGGEDETFHLMDQSQLLALDRQPLLINTSRGSVVDNRALEVALNGRKLCHTVIDVWENEPNISLRLLDLVDIGTPHIAGYSLDGAVNGTYMVYRAACDWSNVEPTWDPTPLMPPSNCPKIELDVRPGQDDEDVLREVVQRAYDIRADDQAFRDRPNQFVQLRAEYPMAREFPSTEVLLHGAHDAVREKCAALGFRVEGLGDD